MQLVSSFLCDLIEEHYPDLDRNVFPLSLKMYKIVFSSGILTEEESNNWKFIAGICFNISCKYIMDVPFYTNVCWITSVYDKSKLFDMDRRILELFEYDLTDITKATFSPSNLR